MSRAEKKHQCWLSKEGHILVFVCSVTVSTAIHTKQIFVKYNMSFMLCPLCASTGFHYHVKNVHLDNAVLRVKEDHGEWPVLSGNTT